MIDTVFAGFLRSQREAGLALAAESDLFDLTPLGGELPQRYVAEFRCKGLVRRGPSEVVEADHFAVGIVFHDQYLRVADPFTVLTWLSPQEVFHPNIRAPFMCVGSLAPGTELVDLVYRCFELVSWQRVTMQEGDALDKEACAWARHHRHLLPVDARALKRRVVDLAVEPLAVRS